MPNTPLADGKISAAGQDTEACQHGESPSHRSRPDHVASIVGVTTRKDCERVLGTGIKFLRACRICEDLGRKFAGRKHVVVTGTGTRCDLIPHSPPGLPHPRLPHLWWGNADFEPTRPGCADNGNIDQADTILRSVSFDAILWKFGTRVKSAKLNCQRPSAAQIHKGLCPRDGPIAGRNRTLRRPVQWRSRRVASPYLLGDFVTVVTACARNAATIR